MNVCHFIESFSKFGFVTVPRLVSPGEITAVREAIDALVDHRRSETSRDESGLTWMFRPEDRVPGFAAGAMARARALAALLMAEPADAVAVSSRLFYKPGMTGVETPWHQDRPYVTDPKVRRTITCWLTLDDVNASNGCMVYAPASHLDGTRRHRADAAGADGDDAGLTMLVADIPADACAVPLTAGDCVLHHDLTLHFSGPNGSASARRALAIRCELMG